MAGEPKNRWIGWVALVIGLLTLMMFVFEVRDGILQGSRSYGITQTSNPVSFYISVTLEGLVAVGLIVFGIYSIRRK